MKVILALLLFACAGSEAATGQRSRPPVRGGPPGNCLIVVLDDVAQADVDEMLAVAHGASLTTTIDALAGQGITFTSAYGNPVCSPSRRSLWFADWYFSESGVGCTPLAGAPGDALISLAEVWPGECGLFGKWHLGEDPLGGAWEGAPGRHGIDAWYGIPGNINIGSCGGTTYSNWYEVRAAGLTVASSGLSTTFNPLAVEQELAAWWLATSSQKLAVWSMSMPHAPFLNPPASVKMPGYPPPLTGPRSQYLAMLAACDFQLGRFIAAAGLDLDNDLVIIVGDNGTPQSIAPQSDKAKTSTFERGVKIPLIMAGAGLTEFTSTRLVHLVDIIPTVCEFLGTTPPISEGLSLTGPAQHQHVLIGQSGGWFGGDPAVPGDWAAVGHFASAGRWKLRRTGLPNQAITEELYDLVADPEETTPLAPSSKPIISQYLRSKLLAEGLP